MPFVMHNCGKGYCIELVTEGLHGGSRHTFIHQADVSTATPGGYRAAIQGGKYTQIKVHPGHKYLVNVGSVGQPRDGDWRAAFVTYDTDEKLIDLHRIPYDIKTAQEKIIKAGLPEKLALRLERGT